MGGVVVEGRGVETTEIDGAAGELNRTSGSRRLVPGAPVDQVAPSLVSTASPPRKAQPCWPARDLT